MPRVKGGPHAHARHKKVLNITKGQFSARHRLFKTANEAMLHALDYATRDRKRRKRDFRRLWIQRINAATRLNDMSYSQFIHGLAISGITLDRKVLADLAVADPTAFASLVETAKGAVQNASA